MKKLSEVSKITGLTRRALQGYDEMGLVPPTAKTEAGYWLYDDEAVRKLIVVKIFTEAGYTRARVKEILSSSSADLAQEYDRLIDYLKEEQRRIVGTLRAVRLFKIESQLSEPARAALKRIDFDDAFTDQDFSSHLVELIAGGSRLDCKIDAYERELFALFWYSLVVVAIESSDTDSARCLEAIDESYDHFMRIMGSIGGFPDRPPADRKTAAAYSNFLVSFVSKDDIAQALDNICGEGSGKRIVDAAALWAESHER